MYRLEMACQIIHDSIHGRPGWTEEYILRTGSTGVGYGSVAVGGPWTGKPTAYEVYVVPHHRDRLLDLCQALLTASVAAAIEVQSNDPLATAMLRAFADDVTSEAILFHDRLATAFRPAGATFRQATASEAPEAPVDQLPWRGVVEVDGTIAAAGGVLFHYNPPYGDIFMDVAEPFRRRGIGSFLVQELKRLCYERGRIPAARCSTGNDASRRALEKGGFVRCGEMLKGSAGRSGRYTRVRPRGSAEPDPPCD